MELLLLFLQTQPVQAGLAPIQPWHIYTVLGGTCATLGGYIRYLLATKDKQIGKVAADKDAIIALKDQAFAKLSADKDAVIAGLTKRIDELQEERVTFVEKMLAQVQSVADAARGGSDASST